MRKESLGRVLKSALTGAAIYFGAGVALAQNPGDIKQSITSRQSISSGGSNAFGEQVNAMTGALTFSAEDIRLKGIGPDIVVHRSTNLGPSVKTTSAFGNWTFDFPSIELNIGYPSSMHVPLTPGDYWKDINVAGTGAYARCTSTPRATIFDSFDEISWIYDGIKFNDGQSRSQLLTRGAQNTIAPSGQTSTYRYIAGQGEWQFSCLSSTSNGQKGEAFLATGPDGTKYYLDYLTSYSIPNFYFNDGESQPALVVPMRVVMGVSRIVDRFGNWVAYHYNGNQIASIDASDGRLVQFTYDSTVNAISQIVVQPNSTSPRTWQYQYTAATATQMDASLNRVILPDGSTWEYSGIRSQDWSYQPSAPYQSSCPRSGDTVARVISYTSTVKAPSGAVGTFTLNPTWHGRSYVPGACIVYQGQWWDQGGIATVFETYSLVQKTISGPGLSTSTWNYAYSPAVGSATGDSCAANATCQATAYVDITDPSGNRTRNTFSTRMDETEGKLQRVEIYSGSSSLIRQIDYQYASKTQGPYPTQLGTDFFSNYNPAPNLFLTPLRQVTITQDGVTFSSYVNSYDSFARPLSVGKWSSLGYGKTDVTEYYDDTTHWVLGQVKRHYNADTNLIDVRNEYDPNTALVLQAYVFEKLKATMTYNADGTLATSKDGNNNTTTYSNWKRGIPQAIQYADGTSISAIVNDNGWVTAVTDENGYSTGYGYDVMGRIAAITYPNEPTFNYNTKTIEFRALTSSDWMPPGYQAGQWRRFEVVGNHATITYYDSLWRPTLVHNYDASNVGPTLQSTRFEYDANGRKTFASYPSSALIPDGTGVHTSYDALDRATQTQQDSELGTLTTTTEYLTGFQVRTTNPRGYQTTNGYQVYDQPSYDQLAWSAQPENKVYEITRNYFGLPGTIKQRAADNSVNVTRTYVYNGNMELCKTIEPETSSTVMGYDAAGNLAWSSTGSSYPDTTNCNNADAYSSGRRVNRTYDSRNRLLTMAFPDGVGNQSWQYTPDGLPSQITNYNDPGNATPVVNAYSYNHRRLLGGETSTQPGWYSWSLGYGYDANANVTANTYPTGLVITNTLNALGQVTQLRDQFNAAYVSSAQYYPNGALSQFTYGNGIVHTMTQNARQLPARSMDSGGVLNDVYNYDGNGNVGSTIDELVGAGNYSVNSRWMSYDGLDRLTGAGSGNFGGTDNWHRYTYNALDNITSWKLAGVKDYANYIYDASNRLTQINNTAGSAVITLSYDVQGNLATKNGQGYQFDYGNRLRNVSGQESYRYDAQGRRVLSWRPANGGQATLSQYGLSGQLMYQEQTGLGNFEYIYLSGSLVATRNNTGSTQLIRYQHTDALGSPVAVTNEQGQVVERTAYEPYGKVIGRVNNDRPGYTGHVMDSATGLTYMQQRYYDPTIGRFLSTDPVQALNGGFNRFDYANNNPYKFTDPDGRVAKTQRQPYTLSLGGGNLEEAEDGGAPSDTFDPTGMTMSDSGAAFLASYERNRLHPYNDHNQRDINEWTEGATIGVGHYINRNDWSLFKNGITQSQSLALYKADLSVYINMVQSNIKVKLTQNQFDALVIFAFNTGNNFSKSSAVKLINNPSAKTPYGSLEAAWKSFNRAYGKVSKGLINRRAEEWEMYADGDYTRQR